MFGFIDDRTEIRVWMIGLFFRFLHLILTPFLWLTSRSITTKPSAPTGILLKSVTEIAAAVRSGDISSEELVTLYVNRVKEVNPLVNAVVEDRFRDALVDAKTADREIAEARKNGTLDEILRMKPLLGVPCTIKESLSLSGMSVAVGFLPDSGRKATKDGAVVQLLKNAGAIPLLVTNTPELCIGWEASNLITGTTNNPHDLNRTSGGSSGGEAALVACGASPFGVGSDLAGSLRLPAAFCGIFTHKVSPGIISNEGHVPYLEDEQFSYFQSIGPMTRSVDDLYFLLNIMAGQNRYKLQLDQVVNIKDIKVYYMTEAANAIALPDVDRSIKESIRAAVGYLQKCGATICQEKFEELEFSIEMACSKFYSMKDIPDVMQDRNNPKREKSMIVEILRQFVGGATRTMQGIGFSILTRTKLFIPESREPEYITMVEQFKQRIESTLGSDGVFIYPVFTNNAHRHSQIFSKIPGILYLITVNVLGLCSVTVPMGYDNDNLPIGIQVIAGSNQDRLCLAVAKQLEIGFGGWRPPQ